jgi:selenide,water dikinase
MLAQVLRPIKEVYADFRSPDLLVGLEPPDDAVIWRVEDGRALVATTDFFTPVVDDPYDYGAIAAANALSDIYAMGGEPFLALAIAALPPQLPADFLAEIIRGGAEMAKKAGVIIAGGHTIQDKEPKFGLVALGWVDPTRTFTKGGLKAGDALVLTKPLGFGVTTTALKQGLADAEDVTEVVTWMKTLNGPAARLAQKYHARGCTDVTGFSLLGHAVEMLDASQVGLKIQLRDIPFVTGAKKYARQWTFPGGATDNQRIYGPRVRFFGNLEEFEKLLLFDPQTSGGLLLGMKPEEIDGFMAEAAASGQSAWRIGEVVDGRGIEIFA